MAAVLRYVAAAKKSTPGTLYVQCHVKPGASKVREGVTGITDEAVEICVAAQPRDGESNKAVLGVLGKALGIPKSNLQITHGAKARDKTISVVGIGSAEDTVEAVLERAKRLLVAAVEGQ